MPRSASVHPDRQPSTEPDDAVFSYNFIAFRDLDLGKRVGSGSFGTVYRATWKGRVVAAKVAE